jgi:hypothetical protein
LLPNKFCIWYSKTTIDDDYYNDNVINTSYDDDDDESLMTKEKRKAVLNRLKFSFFHKSVDSGLIVLGSNTIYNL